MQTSSEQKKTKNEISKQLKNNKQITKQHNSIQFITLLCCHNNNISKIFSTSVSGPNITIFDV